MPDWAVWVLVAAALAVREAFTLAFLLGLVALAASRPVLRPRSARRWSSSWLRPLIDLREQVVSFPPQPVITEDNLVVHIDSVIYFQVTDPKAATYEIADFIQGIEQLTVTTLRNVIGGMTLEDTLTSRDSINAQLRGVLDDATGRWGIRVNRVELKAIDRRARSRRRWRSRCARNATAAPRS